jgi:DNA-binding NarL/FixJ family response regulator
LWGHGGLLLGSGEAGIGKTSLVRDASQFAEALGMRVGSGSCDDLSTTPPYGPWLEAPQDLSDPGAPLPFAASRNPTAPTNASQEGLFQRTRGVLHGRAGEDGLLIVLDDAHWADQASLVLLRFLSHRLKREATGRTVGLRNYVRIWTASYGAAVARHRGDFELASVFIQAGLPPDPSFREGSVWMSFSLRSLRLAAELALDAGDIAQAERWIVAYEHLLAASGRVPGRAEGALQRARCTLGQERPSEAREYATLALEHASAPRQPLALLRSHRMLGEIALALSEPDVAADHLSEARELARACAAVYEGALTMSVEARLALAAGDPDRATRLFDEAAEVAKSLDARPLIERIEYERDRSESVGGYPDALTSREVEVLRLVTEGLTDAQIAELLSISPRTVMTHVSSILGKTGAPSRAAAAAYAVRRGLA